MGCADCDHGFIEVDDGTYARCSCVAGPSDASAGGPVSSDPGTAAPRTGDPRANREDRRIVATGRLPRRPTRRQRVLHALRDGKWHDGYDLCSPDVGGSEGLRRLRELRADGWPIEDRVKAGHSRVHQYRLQT